MNVNHQNLSGSLIIIFALCLYVETVFADEPPLSCKELESATSAGKLGLVISKLQTYLDQYQLDYAKSLDKLLPSKIGDYEEYEMAGIDFIAKDNPRLKVMSRMTRRYRKAGVPEITLTLNSKASGLHANVMCLPQNATPGQKSVKVGQREVIIRTLRGEISAEICLQNISLTLSGTSVTEDQYTKFVQGIGDATLGQIESTVGKME